MIDFAVMTGQNRPDHEILLITPADHGVCLRLRWARLGWVVTLWDLGCTAS
jgi:hypothetical protein